MRTLFAKLRSIAVAGFLFLLPVYVLLIILTRAWTTLASLGTKLAGVFGLKTILGVGGSTALSGLLLIVIWLACGLLVQIRFVDAFGAAVERWLARYIPGYAGYKAMAEEKMHSRVKTLPYTSAFIRQHGYWRPAYVVEQDGDGYCVVFVPSVPDTNNGSVLLARRDELQFVSSITANELDASLKKMGKGLLNEYRISPAMTGALPQS